MVSIIVLSYNTQELVLQCLESIRKHWQHIDHEVIVVDNGSADESIQKINQNFPTYTVIDNKKNYGFAKGCNIGARHAKGNYLLFLNSDTEFQDNSIKKSIELLENDNKAAIVGCHLHSTNGTSLSYGKFYTLPVLFDSLFLRNSLFTREKIGGVQKVDWVSGGCLLIKTEVFTKMRGFDEHYFMYLEDMDLCFQVRRLQYNIFYDPRVIIYHRGQGSSNRTFAIVQIYKGLLYFYKKNKGVTQYILLKFLLFLKAVISICVGTLIMNKYLKNTYIKALRTII